MGPLRIVWAILAGVNSNLTRAFLALLLAMPATIVVGAPSRIEAAPAKFVLPVGSSYKNYAVAKNATSLETPGQFENRPFQNAMQFYSEGERRQREIKSGYLTMLMLQSESNMQTTLRVPLGWFTGNFVDAKIPMFPRALLHCPMKRFAFQRTQSRKWRNIKARLWHKRALV